jgi:hypothetical protein
MRKHYPHSNDFSENRLKFREERADKPPSLWPAGLASVQQQFLVI